MLVALERRIQRLEALVLPVDVDYVLDVLADATRGSVFTVAELVDHARVDERLRLLVGRFSPRQLGKLLQRVAAASPRGGLELVRVGREHNRALWHVR
jgi:hypothetical protein